MKKALLLVLVLVVALTFCACSVMTGFFSDEDMLTVRDACL